MPPKTYPNHDRLHKVRPVLDALNRKIATIPHESHLSVDEQLSSSKARYYLKQYMPFRPHKWGYKFFVLCGVSGFAYTYIQLTVNVASGSNSLTFNVDSDW